MSQAMAASRASAAAAFSGASCTSALPPRPRPEPLALPLLPRGCLLGASLQRCTCWLETASCPDRAHGSNAAAWSH